MLAATYDRFGGPEVITVGEADRPEHGPGQVLVAVRAAGVNQADWKIVGGLFGGEPPAKPRGIGFEVAGVVAAVGTGVEGLAVGDEVLGRAAGGYAEYALAAADDLAAKPAAISWPVAGGLTIAAETAYRCLDLLGVQPGETLLVHGASGSVGAVATQLAGHRGVRVIGTAGERNHDYVRSLGATPVTYGAGLVERVRATVPDRSGPTVDAVLDAAGKGALPDSIELAGGTDRVITIADPDAEAHGVRFTGGSESAVLADVFAEVLPLIADGTLDLRIGGTFPLSEAAQALAEAESGRASGKLVLLP
ncbi:NADP-dependent oxidoreductase [Nocardioides speluncae]|uniref:NADP-dependent oxidoreductase n=1 Tax=Nocardioides speluncae TaxID=2670337 RepID=UPI000D699BCC|nr:NADP-dependent oxidoreductase [Nocardioides speluncae]